MDDLKFVTAIIAFFALAISYIAFCSRLKKGGEKE